MLENQLSFELIERELLRSIVLAPREAQLAADNYRGKPIRQILVRPGPNLIDIPIQFGNRDQNHNMVWHQEKNISAKHFPKFYFLEFFDWNPYGPIDLKQIKVKEANTGRVALINQSYCEFVFHQSVEDKSKNRKYRPKRYFQK